MCRWGDTPNSTQLQLQPQCAMRQGKKDNTDTKENARTLRNKENTIVLTVMTDSCNSASIDPTLWPQLVLWGYRLRALDWGSINPHSSNSRCEDRQNIPCSLQFKDCDWNLERRNTQSLITLMQITEAVQFELCNVQRQFLRASQKTHYCFPYPPLSTFHYVHNRISGGQHLPSA